MLRRSLLILAALAVTTFAHAADKDVEDLLAKMRTAYKAAKSAKASIAVEAFGEDDTKFEATASFTYAGPAKVYIEFNPSGENAGTGYYISDGKKMAAGSEKDSLTAVDYDEDAFPLPLNLETISFWQPDKQLSTSEGSNMHDSELKIVKNVDWDGKTWLTLEESAPKNKVFVRYYIDEKTSMIWRCEVKELESLKPQIDVKITKLETDVDIDDSLFKIG